MTTTPHPADDQRLALAEKIHEHFPGYVSNRYLEAADALLAHGLFSEGTLSKERAERAIRATSWGSPVADNAEAVALAVPVVIAPCMHDIFEFFSSDRGLIPACAGVCRTAGLRSVQATGWWGSFLSAELLDTPPVRGIERHPDWGTTARSNNQRFTKFQDLVTRFAEECDRFGIVLDNQSHESGSLPMCHPLCGAQQLFSYSLATVVGYDRDQVDTAVSLPEIPDYMRARLEISHEILLLSVARDYRRAYELLVRPDSDQMPFALLDEVAHICWRYRDGTISHFPKDCYRLFDFRISGALGLSDIEQRNLGDLLGRILLRLLITEPPEPITNAHQSSPVVADTEAATSGDPAVIVPEATGVTPDVGAVVGAVVPPPHTRAPRRGDVR